MPWHALKAALGTGAAALLLTGCVGLQLEVAKETAGTGDAFNSQLYKGYVALSQSEYDEGDHIDSDYFADRAIAAAGGAATGPQPVAERRIPAEHVGELMTAHREISELLAEGAEKFPKLAAIAQLSLDCWLQELEENRQPDHIAKCRNDFAFAKDALAAALTPPPPPPKPKGPVARLFEKFTVLFDFDSAELTADGMKAVNKAVLSIDQHGVRRVTISGHADRSGPRKYNQTLSQQRAEVVAKALDDNSSTDLQGMIEIMAYGETRSVVPTKDGVREAKNRRVDIGVIR